MSIPFPLITLTVEGMRHEVKVALQRYQLQMDAQFNTALEKALNAENLQHVIDVQVRQCVNDAVSQEIQNAFRYSAPGREAIRGAVAEFMNEYFGEPK